jgi:hypothetical protein
MTHQFEQLKHSESEHILGGRSLCIHMVKEAVLKDALSYIRTTTPLNRCGIEDVMGDEDAVDIQLILPTPADIGVYDMYEECIKMATNYEQEGYRLFQQGDIHTLEDGTPYIFLRLARANK